MPLNVTQVNSCGIRKQHKNQGEFCDEVDCRMAGVNACDTAAARSNRKTRENKNQWCSDYRALQAPGKQRLGEQSDRNNCN